MGQGRRHRPRSSRAVEGQGLVAPVVLVALTIPAVGVAQAPGGEGEALAGGQGDACLAWEGLRADLGAKGLDFDYWLGMRGSPLPSNSLVVRRADLEDPERLEFLKKYLRGWAMGSEFADRNPRAAAEIVFKALESVKRPVLVVADQKEVRDVREVRVKACLSIG